MSGWQTAQQDLQKPGFDLNISIFYDLRYFYIITTGELIDRTCISAGNLNLSASQDSSSDESTPTPVSLSASSADDEDDEPCGNFAERFVIDVLWRAIRNRGLDSEPLNPNNNNRWVFRLRWYDAYAHFWCPAHWFWESRVRSSIQGRRGRDSHKGMSWVPYSHTLQFIYVWYWLSWSN